MATKPTQKILHGRPASGDRLQKIASTRRSKGRLIFFAGLLAVASAAGFWAYMRQRPSAAEIDVLWAQAEADLMAGRFDRVDAALKRLGRLRKPSPLDYMLRGQYAAARKQPEKALEALARVPDEHSMAAQARLLAGQIELRRARVRHAEALFQAALKLDPKLVQAHRELIYIYGMQLRRAEFRRPVPGAFGPLPAHFRQRVPLVLAPN